MKITTKVTKIMTFSFSHQNISKILTAPFSYCHFQNKGKILNAYGKILDYVKNCVALS